MWLMRKIVGCVRQKSRTSYHNPLAWKVLEKVIIVWYELPNSANVPYLVQDNMIRHAMRRVFESPRRLDARYDVRAVQKYLFVGKTWGTKVRTSS